MRKQQKQLIGLIAVLLILAAAFLGLRQYNQKQSEDAGEEAEVLFSVNKDTVRQINYDYQGENYTFEKEEDVWYCANDRNLSLNQTSMGAMAARLAQMNIVNTIENVADMSQYGLDQDYRTLTFETDTESYALWIGDYNDMLDVYYVCRPGESTVYTLSGQAVNCFGRTPEDLKSTEEAS